MDRQPNTEAVMRAAIASPRIRDRFERRIHPVPVPGHGCLIWTGAISGQGHGRFWLGTDAADRDVVVIAHRWTWALTHGLDALLDTAVVRHRCDNPVWQNVEHLRAGTAGDNASDFWMRRGVVGSPLRDVRGAVARARALRHAARNGLDLAAAWDAGAAPVDRIDPLPGL